MANIKIRPTFYGPGKEELNHFKKWSIHRSRPPILVGMRGW